VLLVGAGLLVRSFARLLSVDPGFRSERVVTMAVNLQAPNADAARTRANPFFADVAARVRALPGVQAVAYGDTVPLRQYSRIMMGLAAEGRDDPAPNGPPPDVAVSMVSSQYFTAMGVRLVRGRAFTDDDRQGSPPVAVVNERFARQFWGAEDPVGRRLRFGPRRPDWITVVGVAADVRHDGLAAEPRRTLYQPFAQEPVPFGFIVVRTSGETASTVQAVRQVVRTIDPTLAVYDVATMDERLERSVGGRRFSMLLILAFALVALTLAAVGLYGVLAYIVGERTREIGIRMALGAGLQDVLGMVLRQSGVMVALGVVLGLMAALAVGPLLAAGLFGVTPHDPFTLVSVPLVIAAIAAIATWVPARRAARVDPVEALRDE
jgi:putative ABC transport system permease protein